MVLDYNNANDYYNQGRRGSPFIGCSSLTEIEVDEGTTIIPEYAFREADSLQRITLPDSVTEIEANAFRSADSLREVVFSRSLRSIGNDAFRDCKSLRQIALPESLLTIGDGAFGFCSGLRSLEIPSQMTQINSYAFEYCTGLTEVGGKQYFLGADGKRRSGWTEVEGKRYFLDEEGCIATGWEETEYGRSYFLADGSLGNGWTDTDEGRFYLTAMGTVATGWLDTEEGRMYLDENGQSGSGWTETDTGRTYLTESGIALTGWQQVDGKEYFFRENGIMAIGKVVQDEKTYYFSSSGQLVPLVNKWNSLPEDYTVELVSYGKHQIAAEAHEYLVAMIDQIKGLGYYNVTSIYRSKATQQNIWDRYYNNYRAVGCSKAEAEKLTGEKVAVPGTSEHHLGLAVDIDGVKPVHNWLAEHCWEYGFIVRYPDGTTDITGIEYEPWHFRFVGLELAKELHELGLTLEEYMDMLTKKAGSDAGTASNPEKFG